MAITNDNFCLTVMKELAEVAGTALDPMKNSQPTGLLDALTSDINTSGADIEASYAPGDGKDHKVIVKYLQPDATSEVQTTITDICEDEGASSAYVYDEVTLTLQAQTPPKKLTKAERRALCEDGNTFRLKLMAGAMNALKRNINSQLITPFYGGAGGILSGNGAIGTVYKLIYEDGIPQVNNGQEILMLRNLMDAGLAGTPIVVGGRNIYEWAQLKGIGCCNNYGQDNGQSLGDYNFFYDNQLNTVLTAPSDSNNDAFYVFQPGAAQFVSKPLNVGEFREVDDIAINDTIMDPATGLVFDFDMRKDCNRDWTWKMSLNFDLWQLPLDLFKSTDDRYKVNQNYVFQAQKETAA